MADIVHFRAGDPALAVWLPRCESLHRQLRTDLPAEYADQIAKILAGGAELAILHEDTVPRALVMFRCYLNTFDGYRFYIDDLVADSASPTGGHGKAMFEWCEAQARSRGCAYMALSSGVQRERAHRFYFRQGMSISTFGFRKKL